MRGLTPEERQLMLECASGECHDLMTDQEHVVFDRLHRRGLMRIEDNGELVDSVEVTQLGHEVLALDEAARRRPVSV
jgi:hypothetical protein